jgi:hypothetical protein
VASSASSSRQHARLLNIFTVRLVRHDTGNKLHTTGTGPWSQIELFREFSAKNFPSANRQTNTVSNARWRVNGEMAPLKYASRLRKEHPYWSLRRVSVEVSKVFKKKDLERPPAPETVHRKLMRFFTRRRPIAG